MSTQIIIETDASGQRLYQTCKDGHALYITQLDQQRQWQATLSYLEERNPELFKTMGYQNLKGLLMTTALMTIAASDLSVVASSLYLAKLRLEQIFYMKSAYLIVYETYIAYKDKQRLIKEEAVEAGKEFQTVHQQVSTAWRKFVIDFKVATEVKTIRHQTGGHIHQNFGEWYAAVCSLEPQYTANMLIAFLNCIKAIQDLVNPLLECRLSLLQEAGNKANEQSWDLVEKMEALQEMFNAKQPDDQKLNLDFSLLKNLLTRR